MLRKSPLQLLVLFLGFSFVIYSVAVPASRSLLSNDVELPGLSTQTASVDQGRLVDLRNSEEEEIEGRMDLESTDYPGTGANNRHNPKTPGRA